MNHFTYRNGQLHAEGVPLAQLAAEVGTPFYCYSSATLERHFKVLAEAVAGLDATICFAIKANGNLAVIKTLANLGAGADVVSEGELRRALAAGVPPERIVFSGVGKTRAELTFALDAGVLEINVESEPELELLNSLAIARGKRAVIGLRVNPDVDAHTHAKITTGRKEDKFGIEWTRAPQVLRKAAAMPGIDVASIAVHIGSQLTELKPFSDAFRRLRDLFLMVKADGIALRRIDLGGGLGIPYDDQPPPSPADYGKMIRENLGDLGCALLLEPGRMLVGNAGVLVSRVIYVKEGATRRFLICDAGMNDLIRPAMYDAYHAILPITEPAAGVAYKPMDVVGPICESSDTFARQRPLPPLAQDDLIAFSTAGAYGATMSSTYNGRLLIPEVLVKGDSFAVVRPRPTYDDMLATEKLPAWL
ncbi:diaminopimelate decarboxylase [Telmatospirillum sp.]|uniref:diaminopimelate decarboxylase n=1 Tax=Telmatospirillum sp. TaxID=2079197 RepID=UPI002846DA18|nr:diaminopimelate decarboxylase [Telmatospirillum sp.]MDR3441158.1 diaminopimelate decarboxylase [Telmatospirillum sp.]